VPADFFPSGAGRLDLRDAAQREALAKHLIVQARSFCANRNEQQTWVADLSRRLSLDWDGIVRNRLFHLMTPSEIADAMRRGVDIQLHTHRHRTPRDKAAFCDELCENRRVLEVMTGKRAVHFCYPSGDVDPMFLPWLRELGVETATTGFRGLASETHDQLLLPRFVDTMAQPEVRFESWLSGAGALLP
jgi:peptidoglycan/xylan/chitin deacetylase (PgdA/CDA1 family)